MIQTFHIDDSGDKARAFLNFIKTLDFVIPNEVNLTEEQKTELDLRKESATDEDFIPLEDVNKRLKNKYGL